MYSNGASETIIGKAIKKYNLPRNKLVILTKLYAIVGEDPEVRSMLYPTELKKSKDYVNQGGMIRLEYHYKTLNFNATY